MCCGMSCVGGLGAWYLKDATLGGLLSPAVASSPEGSTPDGSPGPSTADPPAGSIPTGKDVYVFSKLCVDGGGGYSVLSGNPNAESDNHVQMGCKSSKPDTGWKTLWKFEKGGSNVYYVNLSGTKKYLTWEDDGTGVPDGNGKMKGRPVLRDKAKDAWKKRQLWWIGKQSDGTFSLSLSASNNPDIGGRYFSWNYEQCTPGKAGTMKINAPWMWGKDGHESKWGFRERGKASPPTGAKCQ